MLEDCGSNHLQKVKIALCTPPLLPISPPLTPFEPSIEASNLPLLSDQTDSTLAEVQSLENHLANQDSIKATGNSSCGSSSLDSTDEFVRSYSPLRAVFNSSSPAPALKRKTNEIRVEVPLLPNQGSSTPIKRLKTVSFPEMLHEYIPLLPKDESNLGAANSQDDFDAFFDEVIQPLADEANRAIEQEHLQEADSLLRIDVPILDFARPNEPWKLYSRKSNGKYPEGETELAAQQKMLTKIHQEGFGKLAHWPGVNKLDRLVDSWTPCPVVTEVGAFSEKIDDAEYIGTIMEYMGLEDVVLSDSLTWKPEGLRILDNLHETDDELEPAEVEEDQLTNILGLVEKRKQEFDDDEPLRAKRMQADCFTRRSHHQTGLEVGRGGPVLKNSTAYPGIFSSKLKPGLMSNGNFFSASALSNFMHTMGRHAKIDTMTTEEESIVVGTPKIIAEAVQQTRLVSTAALNHYCQAEHNKPYPGPPISSSLPAQSFIVTTNLLRDNRGLMRKIELLHRNAVLIEREFDTIPTATDADILLSPATGIVLTTLQKIHQRPLPGQKAKTSSLKERVLHLSVKYECVIVYVTEGLTAAAASDSTKKIERRDCEALADLSGFGASLDAHVQVTYVGGGEEELARWIIAAMTQYRIVGSESQLLEDETFVNLSKSCELNSQLTSLSGSKSSAEPVSMPMLLRLFSPILKTRMKMRPCRSILVQQFRFSRLHMHILV
jgi:hypothetical protein